MQRDAELDAELFRTFKERLFTAVVGDVLDAMGFRRQFLPAGLAPLVRSTKLAGRAMPVIETDLTEAEAAGARTHGPFGLMFEALDDLHPGEVYVASGSSLGYALWGGLMTTRALHLGAAGAVLDGYVRDSAEIERLQLPVFCRGLYAQDQAVRGKVVEFRTEIDIGGVRIGPGSLILGDVEGVLVVPPEAENEAIRRALEKVSAENQVARAIEAGMSASEAFRKFGVM